MSISDYALEIKGICESLTSINVLVDDDDKVEVCLHGLLRPRNVTMVSAIAAEGGGGK